MTGLNEPFGSAFEALFASPLAETYDLEFVSSREVAPGIRVLARPPDISVDLGQIRISRDVQEFELLKADLPLAPSRGDRLTRCSDGAVYQIGGPPREDRLGLVWIADVYLATGT